MSTHDTLNDFATNTSRKIDQDRRQIVRCAKLLSEAEAWSRPNERCNSVANQILHLTGNMRQWILGGIDGQAIKRNRPAEFAARGPAPMDPILRKFNDAVDAVAVVIAGLSESQLTRQYTIQGYEVSGLLAVFHVAEHVSFHLGQIVHITKAIKNLDLSLYDTQGQNAETGGNTLW